MLLVIDVGNTNIVFGVFHNDSLLHKFRMETDITTTEDEYAAFFFSLIAQRCSISDIKAVVVASVVPSITSTILRFIKHYITDVIYILDHDNHNLHIKLDEPQTLGKDLIANAIAAYALYNRSCIIVDVGTAITFSLMEVRESKACYVGTTIAPGPAAMLNALHDSTAQLPKIPFALSSSVYGKNTITAISAGVFFGCVELIEGIIRRMRSSYQSELFVVMTGGFANIIAQHIRSIDMINPDLTLLGLMFFYMQSCNIN